MIFILQVTAIIASLTIEHSLAIYIACIIPILYIVTMGLGTFTGGSDISLEQLKIQLQSRWVHADELAVYMRRYWYALLYIASANQRQRNCMFLSLTSLGIGIYFSWDQASIAFSATLCAIAVTLFLMALRVNRPLNMFNDPRCRNAMNEPFRTEWRLAATSIVAFSELFPDSPSHKFLADIVMNDEMGSITVRDWRSE